MKVLVCGGRDFTDYEEMSHELDQTGASLIIHGGARGADRLAGRWARSRGVPTSVFPARWEEFGKAAGHIRNQQMLDEAGPDMAVAFPGGNGTQSMIDKARKAGVRVVHLT